MFPFLHNFSVKNEMTDFCLVVEGCDFWVPKGYLGTISPFFRKLCYETARKEGRAGLEKSSIGKEDMVDFLNIAFDCAEIEGNPERTPKNETYVLFQRKISILFVNWRSIGKLKN
jgi:hypothetical protein